MPTTQHAQPVEEPGGHRIEVRPAGPSRWPDLVAVMAEEGDQASCWCQFFRLRGQAWESSTRQTNRAAMREQVGDQPLPPGLIAYLDGEPVGWCAVAPKKDYPRILASRLTGAELDGVWSVSCLVVLRDHRRRGIARAMVDAAVEFARDRGARLLEGYPVDTERRPQVRAEELYHGSVGLFAGAGFSEVLRPSRARVLMRRDLLAEAT